MVSPTPLSMIRQQFSQKLMGLGAWWDCCYLQTTPVPYGTKKSPFPPVKATELNMGTALPHLLFISLPSGPESRNPRESLLDVRCSPTKDLFHTAGVAAVIGSRKMSGRFNHFSLNILNKPAPTPPQLSTTALWCFLFMPLFPATFSLCPPS